MSSRGDEAFTRYARFSVANQWRSAATGHFPAAIRDPANAVFLSVASVWEAVIKHSLGKLPLPVPPAEYLPRQRQLHRIEAIAIDEQALVQLAKLPALHRDPFDRILIAQS